MKTWQAFIVGGICGAVITLGVVRVAWWRTGGAAQKADAFARDEGSRGFARTENERSGMSVKEDDATMTEKIERLRAWMEGRGPHMSAEEVGDILTAWSKRDAREALAFVKGAARFPQRLRALAVPLGEIARKNPGEAAIWIRREVRRDEWIRLLSEISFRPMSDEPRQTLALMFMFPEEIYADVIHGPLVELAKREPLEAMQFWGRVGVEWRYKLDGVISAWSKKDPLSAWLWAEKHRGQANRRELLENLAETRPDLVIAYFTEHRGKADALTAYDAAQVIARLLNRSAGEEEYVLALVEPEAAETALVWEMAERLSVRPEDAIALGRRWLPPEKQSQALRNGFERWLSSDLAGAEAWASTVTDPQLKEAIWSAKFTWNAERNPVEALASLSGRQEIPTEIRGMATRALENWMFRNPAAAAAWTAANVRLLSKEQIGRVASHFVNTDEVGAAAWVTTLPEGMPRETAIGRVAGTWVRSGDFDLANQMVGAVSDEAKRRSIVFEVYRGVRQGSGRGQAKADRWLESTGIDAETRALRARQGGPE